jgi:hypothetical protein
MLLLIIDLHTNFNYNDCYKTYLMHFGLAELPYG